MEIKESNKETVLLVDDEESILEVARTYFKSRGYSVLTAGDGRQAVELLWNNKVDCCFTDINMPTMDGLEFSDFMRKYDNSVPVVVMTGYPSLDSTIHTLKNGVVDYLIKPINLQQMEMCLRRVMRERKLFVENLILAKEVEGKNKLEKLNAQLSSKVDDLNILNRILTDFSNVYESTDVFKQLVNMSMEITKADASCFYMINDFMQSPTLLSSSFKNKSENTHDDQAVNASDAYPEGFFNEQDPLIQKLVEEAAQDGQPLLIQKNNSTWGRLPGQVRSFVLVPLTIRGKIFGVLSAVIFKDNACFCEKDLYYLSFMVNKASVAIENLALYDNIYSNLLSTVYAFVKAIEARDPYTKEHSSRVTHIALALAKKMGCTTEELDILNVAGLLHDIGKIGIRDDILLKPGRLNREEYRIIQQHPIIGSQIMDKMGLWDREKKIVRCHHENYDGTGYPDGLAGEKIPFLARILSVADVYDAIASDRAYRRRMQEDKIRDIMFGGSGSQFDPQIIEVFRQLYEAGDFAEVKEQDE
ncbi:MAG: response regulator [Desulfobacteraceae bacterium]|nr:response regulator [Desulfobacteraceae bacterium]